MTRHIIRISLVMLLGVVTSVAVAWVTVLTWQPAPTISHGGPIGEVFSFTEHLNDGRWWSGFGEVWNGVGYSEGVIESASTYAAEARKVRAEVNSWLRDGEAPLPEWHPSHEELRSAPPWVRQPIEVGRVSSQWIAGRPFKAMRGNRLNDTDSTTKYYTWPQHVELGMPLRPILPGLLANTAIYGGVWWAMLFGPGMLIRWRRRRAGRCAKSGYDLRGRARAPGVESACPECGAER